MKCHDDDYFNDTPMPVGLPMCISICLWDSLHLNEIKDTISQSKEYTFCSALFRLPFICNPSTSRHRSVNQVFLHWSIICQFHNVSYKEYLPLCTDSFIPIRVGHGVRYAINFGKRSVLGSVMDLQTIPQGALCKIWFTFTRQRIPSLPYQPPHLSGLVLHHIEVCTERNAFEKYVQHPFQFHYSLLPPMITTHTLESYHSIIFGVIRYFKHHSFVFPLDYFKHHHKEGEEVREGRKEKEFNPLELFDLMDAFKTYFFLPLQSVM